MLRRLKNAVLAWVACLVMLPLSVCAQRPEPYSWEQFVEEYAEYVGELTDDSDNDVERFDWLEELEEMHRAPININTADRSAFEAMHFLSDVQIDSLLSRRDRYSGGFRSLGELMTVRELSYRDRAWLSLLLTFGPKPESPGDDSSGQSSDAPAWGGAGSGNDSLHVGSHAAQVRRPMETAGHEHRWTSGTYDIIGTADVPLYRRAGFYNYDSDNYATKMFTGYNWAHTLRFRYNWRHRVMYGATVQQDVGERFGAYGSRPWDYQSAYVYYKSDPERFGRCTFNRYTVVAGDYKVHLGQGLIMGQNGWRSAQSVLGGYRAETTSLRPHTGTDENRFLRGAGATLCFGRGGEWIATVFASARQLDGTLSGSEAGTNFDHQFSNVVTAWKTDGLHRTLQEIDKRNIATQWGVGGRIGRQGKAYNVGLNVVSMHYNRDYQPAPRVYNKYYMRGHDAAGASIDYAFRRNQWSLQGELALDRHAAYASTFTLRWRPLSTLSLSLQERSLAKDFVSPYGRPVIVNSQVQNEHGFLFGVRYNGIRHLELTGYVDGALHPHPVYLADTLSHRFTAVLQATYRADNSWTHSVTYRYKGREQNVTNYAYIEALDGPLLSWRSTQHLRWQSTLTAPRYTLTLGVDGACYFSQGSSYDRKTETITGSGTSLGGLVYIRAGWTPTKRLHFSGFLTTFFTDDYNARCYAYVPQLKGSVSVPSFYGRGCASAFVAECRTWRQLYLSVRFSGVRYFDRQSISSGVNLIDSPWKNDLAFQLHWRF